MLREQNNKKIREYLNKQKFAKTDIDLMGNALSTVILYCNPVDVKLKSAIHVLLSVLICTNQICETKGNGKILTCFTSSYVERKDYEKDMRKVLGTMEGYTASFAVASRKLVIKRFLYFFLIIPWLLSMRQMKAGFSYKLYCCAHMLRGYIYREELTQLLRKRKIHPKLVVTFCDVHVCDYFITSFFNKRNIPTATLQHAVFDHINTGYANSFSMSCYFLGISEYGKQEYIKSGKDGSNYVVLGSLKYIGKNTNTNLQIKATNVIGIALSGVAFQEENKDLIIATKKLAEEFGYKVLIRCHPALNPDDYEKEIDHSIMEINRSKSLEEFSEKCDFTIMGSTNTFGDLIANGHLALRMILRSDLFDGIECFKFRNYEELRNEVISIRTELKKTEKRFNYVRGALCAPGNIEKNYTVFFHQILESIEENSFPFRNQ